MNFKLFAVGAALGFFTSTPMIRAINQHAPITKDQMDTVMVLLFLVGFVLGLKYRKSSDAVSLTAGLMIGIYITGLATFNIYQNIQLRAVATIPLLIGLIPFFFTGFLAASLWLWITKPRH